MKKIYISGAWDLFHIGHLNILQKAKELGDHLIVGVDTDEMLKSCGRSFVIPYEQRKRIVEALKCVDEVIPHNSVHEKFPGDLRVLGADWVRIKKLGLSLDKCVVLSRTPDISTTIIKEKVMQEVQVKEE